MSIPVFMSMISVAAGAQPASLPEGLTIGGRYYCNTDITGSSGSRSEINLMYNAQTGNLTGLPARTARHSFGYTMTKLQMERTHKGIFYWGADMRNRNHYPTLSNVLFLLANGDLAAARVTRVPDGTDYVVTEEDIKQIVVFSRTGNFTENVVVAKEISKLATSLWGGKIFEDNMPDSNQ